MVKQKQGVQKTLGRSIFWMLQISEKGLWSNRDAGGNPMYHFFSICRIGDRKHPGRTGVSIVIGKYKLNLAFLSK